jgi:formylglycine-generating enzyme required for sulfatase activity
MHKAGTTVITARKAADTEYAEATRSYTLTVEPKPVSISGLGAANKVYDGTTTVTITGTTEIVGLVGGDEVTVIEGTAEFGDKNAGTDKPVSFTGWSLGGADEGNYSLFAQPTATANITAKPVTITGLTAANKVYDRTTTATFSGGTISGSISGDIFTFTGTAAFVNATVGNGKTVTFSGFSLGGANAGNYSLSAQPASTTANITAKPVTITGLSAANKVYDRTTTATPSGGTISGSISGDVVTFSCTAAFANATVGNNKTVTFSGFSLGGANAGNYSLSAQPANATANITAKPVTITGLTVNKFYDGTTTATPSGGTINGVISGDTVTINYGTATFSSATVGANKTVTFTGFSLGGASAGNYSLSQPASITATIRLFEQAWINAGNFQMGSPTNEPGRTAANETQHQVTLNDGFYMGKYQITQSQYVAVIGSNPSFFKDNPADGEIQVNRPVQNLSWYDALVFCNKLSTLEGLTPAYRINNSTDPAAWGSVPASSNTTWNAVAIVAGSTGYRLPTEAQWEYACRATTTTAFNNRNNDPNNNTSVGAVAWFNGNSGAKTHEVGKKLANDWGLYDMHGNVLEWCQDWYAANYGGTGAQTNPTGPSSGNRRVLRGGIWNEFGPFLRSASRYDNDPFNSAASNGIRLVRP